jgi:tetratricopeptide (TPR) repeat protein
MKKNLFLIVMLFSFQHPSFSQDKQLIDSLQAILKTAKQDTARAKILNQLSIAYRGNNPDKAMDYAKQSLALSEEIGYKKGVGNAYGSMGNINVAKGDFAQALELQKKAFKIREEIGDKKGIVASYNAIGGIYIYQGNYDEALKNFSFALKINEEIGDKTGIAGSYNNIGTIFKKHGNYPDALKNSFAALNIYEEIGDKKDIVKTYHNIGTIYYDQGNYPEALRYYFASLKLKEEIGDKQGIYKTYTGIGLIYQKQGNYPEALRNFFAALKIAEEIGDKKGVADLCINIGSIYIDQGKYPEALKNFSTALKIANEIGDKQNIAVAYDNIGTVYCVQHNFPEALKNCFAGLKIAEEIGDKHEIAGTLGNIGGIYTKQKKFSDASQYLTKAISLSKETGNLENIRDNYNFLAQLDSAKGNYKQALEHYKIYITTRDSLVNKENTKKIMQQQMQYEFDKKESLAKAEQEKKDALAQKELQKQKYKLNLTRILYAGIGSIIIIFLLVVLLWIQRKRFRSDRKALILEQRLLRSQMNPHFLFNSLTSIQNFIVTEKPDKASIYLSKFSTLVRNILDNSMEEVVPLEREISIIENYLELQKVRYAGKFEYRIGIADAIDPETVMIPPMLAQPFIENSIEHGIRHRETTGHIDIRFSLNNSILVFEVEDDGVGRQKAREIEVLKDPAHRSMATSLTRERLININSKLRKKIVLEITDLKNSLGEATGTKVMFGIPIG